MSLELWQTLIIDNDYEINANHYPWQIRRKSNHHVVAIINRYDGYQQIKLNANVISLHRVIATQFVHNDDPEHKTQVDHRNKHRNDNRIENLRWVTPGVNQQNKVTINGVKVNYVDEISDDCIVVDEYSGHQLENYYYSEEDDLFYQFNGVKYRILEVHQIKTGAYFVNVRDVNGKNLRIFINKFKTMHDLN